MHAWVLRNRHRLRLIYGPAEGPSPRRPATARGASVEERDGAVLVGHVVRDGDGGVELRPMPRRVG